MPPHLHPRSAATSTLFAGTLLASFIVIGIPHIFPCPRPRRSYADSRNLAVDRVEGAGAVITATNTATNGQASSQVRQVKQSEIKPIRVQDRQGSGSDQAAVLFRQLEQEAAVLDKQAHECPVPKPTGWLGQVLGFDRSSSPGQLDQPLERR